MRETKPYVPTDRRSFTAWAYYAVGALSPPVEYRSRSVMPRV
jgi:hypothetical protein